MCVFLRIRQERSGFIYERREIFVFVVFVYTHSYEKYVYILK